MADVPEFSDQDIKSILNSLSDSVDQKRVKLLPAILREWASTNIPLHLSIQWAKVKKDRAKRLKAVADTSAKLLRALDAIDRNDERFWIVRDMIVGDGQRLTPVNRTRLEKRFERMRDCLGKLSAASVAAGKIWKQGRGQPHNNAASLVLMDIVAIYEWLTGRKATRQVNRDTLKDTGPFWEFAAAVWSLVFRNGTRGLSAAIKNWRSARKRKLKGTHSPILANIAVRHPEWRIFET